jgi:hypothetical protein
MGLGGELHVHTGLNSIKPTSSSKEKEEVISTFPNYCQSPITPPPPQLQNQVSVFSELTKPYVFPPVLDAWHMW